MFISMSLFVCLLPKLKLYSSLSKFSKAAAIACFGNAVEMVVAVAPA